MDEALSIVLLNTSNTTYHKPHMCTSVSMFFLSNSEIDGLLINR